jgi:hypothetical protein
MISQKEIGFVLQNSGPTLATSRLLRAFAPLCEPYSRSSTVLRNELDARSFEGGSYII